MAAARVAAIAAYEDAPSTLSIKELKAALARHGVDYAGCVERRELVELLEQARPVSALVSSAKRPRTDSHDAGSSVTSVVATATPPPAATLALLRSAHLSRLLSVLPREERRQREPNPERLCDPHQVPGAAAHQLRVCTFNLLDDVRVSNGQGGLHAVWDVRRVNVLRCLLAIDADLYLLQELNAKSLGFLRGTLGPEYTLVAFSETVGGVGIMYRAVPPPVDARRAVYLAPAGAPTKRRLCAPSRPSQVIGIALHVPLVVHGLARTPTCASAAPGVASTAAPAVAPASACPASAAPPFRLVASSTHLTLMERGQLQSCNREARYLGAALGRDLLRLPAAHGHCPMLLGGDFNSGADGKRATTGGTGGPPSLYAELTHERRRRPEGQAPDSEEEWSEDEQGGTAHEEALRWPPPGSRPLARDLFRDSELRERDFGGLQRGSTCQSVHLQNFEGRLQGVEARAANEKWHERWPDGECTDGGHIDWLMASTAHDDKTQPLLRARRALICTERLCAPLPPQQPSLVVGPSGNNIPKGGAIFPSDHYPVVVDLETHQPRTSSRAHGGCAQHIARLEA